MESGNIQQGKIFVDGEWKETPNSIEVYDLCENQTFTKVGSANTENVEEALEGAKLAEPKMREMSVVKRAEILTDIADGIEKRQEKLAETIVREAGKPIKSARNGVTSAIKRLRRSVEEVRAMRGEYRRGTTEGHENWEALVKPEPRGTVVCIPPYNYPLSTTVLQIAPALAAGNAVILKPSSKTPVSSMILTEIIAKTDLPDGAFNFLPGSGSEIGDPLVGDKRVNYVAMTGGSESGKHVAKQTGLTGLHMELGGNAPAIVFPDADLSKAAEECTKGSLKYAGQRCSAVSRIIAHKDIHDELVNKISEEFEKFETGDLFNEKTSFGPIITEEHAREVEKMVDDTVEKGGEIVIGGNREGHFHEATLVANAPHESRLIQEETFGPVATVTKFESEKEALNLVNSGNLALDGSVFTKDYDRARRVANEVDAGSVRINGAPSHGIGDIPFGGNKDSGIGREGLHLTIEDMTRKKTIIL